MRRNFEIRRVHLANALNTAASLFAEAGYLLMKKEKGIVEWQGEPDIEGHACHIRLRSFISIGGNWCFQYGCITVDTCGCEQTRRAGEIIRRLGNEFAKRNWNNAERRQYASHIFCPIR